MSVLPDPGELRAIADRIAAHATGARARAARLGGHVQTIEWHGSAANTFRATAHAVLGELRRSAARLDDAADALRRHATRIQAVLDRLHQLVGDLSDLTDDTVDLLRDDVLDPLAVPGDAVGLVGDGVDLVGDGVGLVGDMLGI